MAGGQEVGRISIRVMPDTTKFRQDLKKKLEAIEKSIKATIPVDVDLDAAGAKAHMRELMADLKAQCVSSSDLAPGSARILAPPGLVGPFGSGGGLAGA
jgi:hypothetical protein